MPEPPSVDLLTRFVLEHPWPGSALLALAGVVLVYTGLREGRPSRQRVGVVLVIVAAALVLIGWQVQTSGERARIITRRLVEAAATNDLVGIDALLAPSAVLTAGRPRNPGLRREVILEQAARLRDDFAVESNRISALDAYTVSAREAEVHVTCWTEFPGGLYNRPSQWVVQVERQADETWQVTKITCVSIAGRDASSRWWR